MSEPRWKAIERQIARYLGGRRTGSSTSEARQGKNDLQGVPGFGIEVKHLSRPCYADLVAAFRQAQRNSGPDETPVAIVHRNRDRICHSLVVMDLETWRAWYISNGDEKDVNDTIPPP